MIAPKLHPAWKITIGLAILFFLTIGIFSQLLFNLNQAVNTTEDQLVAVREQQEGGEERSYILRALAGCTDLINDQEVEITTECTDPRVAAYYPPSICAKLPVVVQNCGKKTVVVT